MSDLTFTLPNREESLAAARRQLAHRLGSGELVWLLGERYDEPQTTWYIDVARLGAQGRWVRTRHRYDGQAETMYYLGESALSDAEFRAVRRSAQPFDVAGWQQDH